MRTCGSVGGKYHLSPFSHDMPQRLFCTSGELPIMVFEGFPHVVGWELTLACNLRCRHCASSAGFPRANELNLDEALNLCDQLPALLVQEVDFTGGEPLLCANWTKIAAHLAELQIPTRLVTNGLLLKENVPRLIDAGVTTVGVSLDGLEVTHDRIRGQSGVFQRAIVGLEAALSAGLPTAVITAVNDFNVSELPKLLAMLQGLGIRHWQVQPTFAVGRAREGGKLELSESSYLELGKFIRGHVTPCEKAGFRIMPADGVGYFTELDIREPRWRGCAAGRASCGITSDGNVKGCLSFPDSLIEGNLRERDLWNIWFDDASFAYNRRFSPVDLGEACASCEFGEQCGGGCGVMSYAATQQFHNDPYCFHAILARRESKPSDNCKGKIQISSGSEDNGSRNSHEDYFIPFEAKPVAVGFRQRKRGRSSRGNRRGQKD